jgi:hypothetical protein
MTRLGPEECTSLHGIALANNAVAGALTVLVVLRSFLQFLRDITFDPSVWKQPCLSFCCNYGL